ncbi:putative leader peptide [Nakamurella endophytica]
MMSSLPSRWYVAAGARLTRMSARVPLVGRREVDLVRVASAVCCAGR